MAYCTDANILIGDVTPVEGIVAKHINQAADEIDAAIGHLYVVPVTGATGHVALMLKTINIKLATGRYFAAMSRGNEEEQNYYAASLIKEAMAMLDRIATGQVILDGVGTNAPSDGDDSRSPTLINVDSLSGVGAFYNWAQREQTFPSTFPIVEWDDGR